LLCTSHANWPALAAMLLICQSSRSYYMHAFSINIHTTLCVHISRTLGPRVASNNFLARGAQELSNHEYGVSPRRTEKSYQNSMIRPCSMVPLENASLFRRPIAITDTMSNYHNLHGIGWPHQAPPAFSFCVSEGINYQYISSYISTLVHF
jgi:hypothetical protein